MHLYDLSSAHPLRSHRSFHAAVSAPMMISRETPIRSEINGAVQLTLG
jgi:hypothetical protein